MIISELKIYNFRRFKSVGDVPGLKITFHKGLNALIGENDSGKTAVIDALKLVLLTQSNEYIRPVDEDFYKPVDGDACSEFKIDCTISEFTRNEAKNFIEYLTFKKDGEKVDYTLELHYSAWKEGHKIYQELRVGDIDDGILIDGKARELLKAVYLNCFPRIFSRTRSRNTATCLTPAHHRQALFPSLLYIHYMLHSTDLSMSSYADSSRILSLRWQARFRGFRRQGIAWL